MESLFLSFVKINSDIEKGKNNEKSIIHASCTNHPDLLERSGNG